MEQQRGWRFPGPTSIKKVNRQAIPTPGEPLATVKAPISRCESGGKKWEEGVHGKVQVGFVALLHKSREWGGNKDQDEGGRWLWNSSQHGPG